MLLMYKYALIPYSITILCFANKFYESYLKRSAVKINMYDQYEIDRKNRIDIFLSEK